MEPENTMNISNTRFKQTEKDKNTEDERYQRARENIQNPTSWKIQ